jgi:hypothetical protein
VTLEGSKKRAERKAEECFHDARRRNDLGSTSISLGITSISLERLGVRIVVAVIVTEDRCGRLTYLGRHIITIITSGSVRCAAPGIHIVDNGLAGVSAFFGTHKVCSDLVNIQPFTASQVLRARQCKLKRSIFASYS